MTLGLTPLREAFRAGSDDPVQALERALAAAERGKGDRALLWLVPAARDEAEASRERWRRNEPLGPLDGMPIVVKDCIDIAGLPTTNGTAFLTEPVSTTAPVIERLRAAGAVIFGKANMHEFGIQPLGINPHHGTPVNPWAPDRIPGGSSAGSAVAVASGIAAAAVGTDAGGSVRVPAALNGLVGLKASYGAVPDDGVARLTRDLDHVGPMGWTVDDVTVMFEAMSGRSIDREVKVERIGVLTDFFGGADADLVAAVRAAISECFGECAEEKTPMCAWASAVEFVTVGTDASQLIGELLVKHGPQMAPDSRFILQLGGGLTAEDRRKADGVRRGMVAELKALLERYDVLVGPMVGCFAPMLHEAARKHGELDTATMGKLAAATFPANLTGFPSATVPCVRSGMPTGLQILGAPGDEAKVLAAARVVEAKFGPRKPPRWHGG